MFWKPLLATFLKILLALVKGCIRPYLYRTRALKEKFEVHFLESNQLSVQDEFFF